MSTEQTPPVVLSLESLLATFADVPDPRRDHLKRFSLRDVLILALAGVLAGCEGWVEIADFGEEREAWFREHGLFPEGTPSHDTLARIFRILDADAFRRCFAQWMQRLVGELHGVVAIDGKTARSSADGDRPAIHTVSAYATEPGLTLAHVAVPEKSNEITAIPRLLDDLAITGCTVTIDAMGCQKEIAEKIRTRGAHYLLQVKGNQAGTLADLTGFFDDADARGWSGTACTTAHADERGHGRVEQRSIHACPVRGHWLDAHGWKDLRQIVRIRRQRTIDNHRSTEDSYYITSETCSAERLLVMARQHWGIEARTHWVLDVVFNEDRCTVRKDHAAHNFTTIRRFVLNLLRRNPETKHKGLRRRRRLAGYNMDHLVRLLNLVAVSPGG